MITYVALAYVWTGVAFAEAQVLAERLTGAECIAVIEAAARNVPAVYACELDRHNMPN